MYDKFDSKLSGRIRDVFENFEDDSAEYGWQELRKRFPGKEKKRPVALWWSSAAAILILALGTAVYYNFQPEKVYLTGNYDTGMGMEAAEEASETTSPKNEEQSASTTPDITEQYGLRPEGSEMFAEAPISNTEAVRERKTQSAAVTEETPVGVNAAILTGAENVLAADNGKAEPEQPAAIEQPSQPVYAGKRQEALKGSDITITEKSSAEQGLPELPVNINDINTLAGTNRKRETKQRRQVSVGVYAGSFFNYAEGSEGSMNTSVGLQSEIAITKKLKLSTGVSLAQNDLSFEGRIPTAAASAFMSPSTQAADAKNALLGPGMNVADTYSINRYMASLTGIDIPVNLRYNIIDKKSELYLTAGFSSNFFLDETYTYDYRISSNSGNKFTSSEDGESTTTASSFDFARMLNLSVGVGYPMGKQSRLSLEPFIKYPLGGLGSRDLRFGSAGMNLKFNFNTTGKRTRD